MNKKEYFTLLASLLPPVTYDVSGQRLSAGLKAEARMLADLDGVIAGLLTAADPEMATATLPDWERVYALTPEEGEPLQRRRDRVMAAFAETGGLSRNYFIHLARTLGYDLTIEEPDNPKWRWIVNIHSAPEKVYYFRVGESSVGDRLEEAGDPDLETLFNRLKPAHTECVYKYIESAD